jgi:hypothetical protein
VITIDLLKKGEYFSTVYTHKDTEAFKIAVDIVFADREANTVVFYAEGLKVTVESDGIGRDAT